MKNVKIFLISLFGILFLSSCGLWSSAIIPPDECFETDGETITKYDFENENCPTSIIIPEKIRGTEITKIGNYVFSNPAIFDSKEIPFDWDAECEQKVKDRNLTEQDLKMCLDWLESMKKWFKTLTKVEFGDNITHIQRGAFSFNNLRKIHFWKNLKYIDKEAFFANNIIVVTFSDEIHDLSMNSWVFSQNPLKNIALPKSIQYKDDAFDNTTHIEILK